MLLIADERGAVGDLSLEVPSEDVLEGARRGHLLRSDQWQLCPSSQRVRGHPVGIAVHSDAVFFAAFGDFIEVGLGAAALDHPVVPVPQDFPPKANALDLLLCLSGSSCFLPPTPPQSLGLHIPA
jgi:hypothetical protein